MDTNYYGVQFFMHNKLIFLYLKPGAVNQKILYLKHHVYKLSCNKKLNEIHKNLIPQN